MKIWCQHGSEHSANLVMIGQFKDATEAAKAKEIIDALTEQVTEEQKQGRMVVGSPSERFGDEMLDLLLRLNVGSIGPGELEQLAYDVRVKLESNKIVVTTDELDVAVFIKIMFLQGARIELFSRHDYPDTGDGREE